MSRKFFLFPERLNLCSFIQAYFSGLFSLSHSMKDSITMEEVECAAISLENMWWVGQRGRMFISSKA